MNFSLKGESILWLILRTEDKLDDYSSIIKISKEEKSQKLFISFGTMVEEDDREELVFKIFTTQQLIDTSSNYFKILYLLTIKIKMFNNKKII